MSKLIRFVNQGIHDFFICNGEDLGDVGLKLAKDLYSCYFQETLCRHVGCFAFFKNIFSLVRQEKTRPDGRRDDVRQAFFFSLK